MLNTFHYVAAEDQCAHLCIIEAKSPWKGYMREDWGTVEIVTSLYYTRRCFESMKAKDKEKSVEIYIFRPVRIFELEMTEFGKSI